MHTQISPKISHIIGISLFLELREKGQSASGVECYADSNGVQYMSVGFVEEKLFQFFRKIYAQKTAGFLDKKLAYSKLSKFPMKPLHSMFNGYLDKLQLDGQPDIC